MAESCVIVEETLGTVKKVKWTWVSAADGSVGAALVNTTTSEVYNGAVLRAVFVPDAGGTQPSDNYDVQIQDEDTYDILAAQGDNLSHAAAVTKVASMGAVANDKLKLSITNAGDSKGGVVYVYIR
jgi:hypothetical protein